MIPELVPLVTACGALLVALSGVIAGVAVLIPIWRNVKTTNANVTQQGADAGVYHAITTEALRQAGIPVPPEPPPTDAEAPRDREG
jgi:hypothetical protein